MEEKGGRPLPEKHLRFLLYLLYGALGLAGMWLALRFLLPWLAPFLVGLALAALVEPAVKLLTGRPRLPRWGASALCILGLTGAAAGILGGLLWRLTYEAGALLAKLPTLLAGAPTLTEKLERWSYRFLIALPIPLREAVQTGLDGLLEAGAALPNRLYGWLAGVLAGAAAALPAAALFFFTAVLAAYLISANWPEYRELLVRLTPESWQNPLRLSGQKLKRTLGGWLRAQGTLMLVTFGELAAGLLVLRVEFFLLLAAAVALVDALPVFGTGAVLVPWAVVAFLSGQTGLGLGLLALYGVVSLIRSLLEPKLVGDQTGLPPLGALAAMYAGYRLLGVAGMILAPLAASLVCQLWPYFFHKNS